MPNGQADDYTTDCLLDYFRNCYKIMAIDLSKQQALDTDPRAIQQINFTANLQIEKDKRKCILLLKKQKKPF